MLTDPDHFAGWQAARHFSKPAGNPLAVHAHAQQVEALEDLFILELVVASDRFGFSPQERRAWAVQSVLTAEHVPHYIAAWKRANSAAWKRLNFLADELRRTCGDDRGQWEARLLRLEQRASESRQAAPAALPAELGQAGPGAPLVA